MIDPFDCNLFSKLLSFTFSQATFDACTSESASNRAVRQWKTSEVLFCCNPLNETIREPVKIEKLNLDLRLIDRPVWLAVSNRRQSFASSSNGSKVEPK